MRRDYDCVRDYVNEHRIDVVFVALPVESETTQRLLAIEQLMRKAAPLKPVAALTAPSAAALTEVAGATAGPASPPVAQ